MSLELLNAVFKADIKPSSMKFVLLAMSDYANEHDNNECFPSRQTIVDKTGLNLKTVQKYLLDLEELGYITDTGKRKGRTQLIKIWSINLGEIVNRPKNGTVPLLDGNRPKNGSAKQTQKRVTEPLVINLKERIDNKDVDESLNPTECMFLKPDEVDSELWSSFMKLRVKKKAVQSKRALHALVNKLVECTVHSIPMDEMIALCLESGWKGVNYEWYENKAGKPAQVNQFAGYR